MDDKKFLMWRACFAILKLDGVVTEAEQNWAENVFFDQDFTDKQEKTLRDDLANKSEFDQIFSQITNPVDRAYVLHMVRTLGNIDEDYDEKERAAFKRVEAKIQSSVNIDLIKEHIEKIEKDSYTSAVREEQDLDKPLLYRGYMKLEYAVEDFILWLKNR